MKNETVLIVGASGTVGSEIAKILKAEGHNVRLTTSRKPAHKEQVQIDLLTGQGIREAFEGVDRAFFLSPPGHTDQYSILSPLIQEAKRRGLKKVVLMTAMGANMNPEAPFRRAEVELEKSGLTYNIIRPTWFAQNFATMWSGDIRAEGKIKLPAGEGRVGFIDSRDISAVAAKLLFSDKFNNKDFDLTGPVAMTHADAAKVLSQVTGKKIVFDNTTPDQFLKTLLGFGLKKDYAEFLVMIMGFLRDGYSAQITGNVKEILGREPHSFERFAQDFKSAWV